jgi:hypothetical protein
MEILKEILLVVFIFVGIWLIAVLWRAFEVFGDLHLISQISAKRVKQLDEGIETAKQTVVGVVEGMKAFLFSFDFIRSLRNSFNKKERDGE